jgi:hypothetical protein
MLWSGGEAQKQHPEDPWYRRLLRLESYSGTIYAEELCCCLFKAIRSVHYVSAPSGRKRYQGKLMLSSSCPTSREQTSGSA